jgi:hypothetical protein
MLLYCWPHAKPYSVGLAERQGLNMYRQHQWPWWSRYSGISEYFHPETFNRQCWWMSTRIQYVGIHLLSSQHLAVAYYISLAWYPASHRRHRRCLSLDLYHPTLAILFAYVFGKSLIIPVRQVLFGSRSAPSFFSLASDLRADVTTTGDLHTKYPLQELTKEIELPPPQLLDELTPALADPMNPPLFRKSKRTYCLLPPLALRVFSRHWWHHETGHPWYCHSAVPSLTWPSCSLMFQAWLARTKHRKQNSHTFHQ